MSKYTDYDSVSVNYDKTRKAVGIEIVLGFLASLPQPREGLRVLDAGCGTGNYAIDIQRWFPQIVCLDYSIGMLRRAHEKFSRLESSRAGFVQADMADLPFADGVFDAVVCNQSLHHIDEPRTDFKNQRRFFHQANRALKMGGAAIINTITHEQLRDGVWWGDLIKPAVERMTERFTSNEKLQEILETSGFEITDQVVPVSTIIQQEGYFDEDALHRKEFRDGDSHFSLLTPAELQDILARIDAMRAAGRMGAYIAERDLLRQRVGQFTYFVARKKREVA